MRSVLLALIISTTAFACTTTDTPSEVITTVGSAAKTTVAEVAGSAAVKPVGEVIRPEHAADDQATADLDAHREAQMNATAAKEVRDEVAEKLHAAATDKFQANFDASDRKFNTMKEKAKKAPAATKKVADAAAVTIATREVAVMADIKRLRNTTGRKWDTAKTEVELDSSMLDKAIDALGVTLN